MAYQRPVNNFATTLASTHTSADGQLVLQSGDGATLGVLGLHQVYVVTAVVSGVVVAIFQATGLSTDTLTGVTAIEGFSDLTIPSGNAIEVRLTAGELTKLQAGLVAPTWVYLSQIVVSDALGAIGYGATAPTGSDPTSTIQAAIDAAPSGAVIVWDVAVGISAPILIPSHVTIYAPSRAYGAILRAAANCPMFRNKGITTDATASLQKTFGKLDGAHPGNAKYRILEPVTYINDRQIALIGGTWNGNRAQQTGLGFTATYGFLSLFQFWGVEDVLIEGCYFLVPKGAVTAHFINWHRVTVRDVEFEMGPLDYSSSAAGAGGLQFNGPGQHARVTDPITHCSDDTIAFNADDSDATAINSTYGGGGSVCTPGVNWTQCGDITDVVVRGHTISDGIEGVTSAGAGRLLTSVHLIDQVLFDGQVGTCQHFAYNIGAHNEAGLQLNGAGNLGECIEFRGSSVELTSPDNSGGSGMAVFDIDGGGRCVRITDRQRSTIPLNGVPDVKISDSAAGASTLATLYLSGTYYDDGTNHPAAQILCATTVNRIIIRTVSSRAGSTTITAPALKTATGAVIALVDFGGDLRYATNIIDHQAGTVTTILMRGSHQFANGGSPLNIASGLTVLNAWSPDLAFVAGNGLASGAGTLTHANAYADS